MTSHTNLHLKPMMSFGKRSVLTIQLLLLARLTRNRLVEYQCPDCPYAYNEEEEDPDKGITPGSKFEDLPIGWSFLSVKQQKQASKNKSKFKPAF